MTNRTSIAASVLSAAALVLSSFAAQAQVTDLSNLDHLKCYQIKDSLSPNRYQADLRNQFGVEPGCIIMTPARLLCVETDKLILPPQQPPGGGPSGTPAGHFLCYAVRCPSNSAPPQVPVEDQFGRREIRLDSARILCAPADKLICGDGDLDPGEQCDPGDLATSTCPNGVPCQADCTCPDIPPVCCQCPNSCTIADGTICPSGCETVVGATCNADGLCEVCPCGQTCTTTSGEVGICREPPGNPAGVCSCYVPPPPECPCDATCIDANGQAGICQPVPGGPTNLCACGAEQPATTGCHCGKDCIAADGTRGRCLPKRSSSGSCECTTR
jgi:hypothetical protein